MQKEQNTFQFTYSAKQQEEIKKIREKYIPKEENKMEQLRRLDESATRPGTITALAMGIFSTLVLGVGMCCTMVWADTLFIPGIIIGVMGMIGLSITYPIYSYITKKQRTKLAPEIMRLTDELSHS